MRFYLFHRSDSNVSETLASAQAALRFQVLTEIQALSMSFSEKVEMVSGYLYWPIAAI